MVRQENIQTASTVTSIIPTSTFNCDHSITVISAQNNQPETIFFQSINLNISNTLQKAKNVANRASYNTSGRSQNNDRHDFGRSQSVTEGQGSVNESQTHKLCHSEAYGTVLTSKRAYNATRSLSRNLQSQPEDFQQILEVQRVPDPFISVEKLHQFVPDCANVSGQSQNLKVSQLMASIDGKEKHDAFHSSMEGK
ncbi:hypothetical protein O181_001013 [Austropuccinia psidii MF-1]|uniref:Uncharacterized protein n=1 Tax=Austropuccinia psidii MF-1 TaxID=1389203 RepID=A0A9Q3B9N6_9BASI|nr:hypothetical protein [Austropuccinia psidii MF-1]